MSRDGQASSEPSRDSAVTGADDPEPSPGLLAGSPGPLPGSPGPLAGSPGPLAGSPGPLPGSPSPLPGSPGPRLVPGLSPRERRMGWLYATWTAAAVLLPLMRAGLSADNVTRLLIILFLLLQVVGFASIRRAIAGLAPRVRFVATGVVLASVAEGCYMISKPCFPCLRIGPETPWTVGLADYAIDLAFTVPAYVIILGVIWRFVTRYRYGFWEYVLLAGAGQALGDGFVFFVAAPAMVLFLPYVMLNYHAMNVVPYLLVREGLPTTERSRRRFLLLPALIATYLVCGACICLVGRWTGLG